MKRVEFIHRTTKEKVSGYQYIQGVHPPPPDVTVTMGLGGVVARVDTVRGSDTDLNSTDWILMLPGGAVDIFDALFVKNQYRRVDGDDDEGPAKPVKLG